MKDLNDELESRLILKIYGVYDSSNYYIVDYKCLLCGAVHEKVSLKIRKNKKIKVCNKCNFHKFDIAKHSKILNILLIETKNQQNFIVPRLMFSDKLKIRQMLEEFLAKDNNLELLQDENNTIGLKNPFVDTIWIENLIVKTTKEDKIDRNRYFNNVSKYENISTARTSFKKVLNSQNLNFNDFTEIFNEEYDYYIEKGREVRKKRYNYYFKKGTIEEYYYKGE